MNTQYFASSSSGLQKTLSTNPIDIRKPNIEHNLNTRIQRLAKKVDDAIKEHENKINDYNEFAEKSSNVQNIIDQNLKTTDSRAWTIDISTIINSRKPQIKTKADYEDVKTKVEKFLKTFRNGNHTIRTVLNLKNLKKSVISSEVHLFGLILHLK